MDTAKLPALPAPSPTTVPSQVSWVTVSRPHEPEESVLDVRPGRVLLQFAAALAAVLLVVGVLGSLAARRLAEREAVNDAAATADVVAASVITPALTDSLPDGDPAAVAVVDKVVRERVLGRDIIRVKLWTPSGKVVYSDEPNLIGRTFPLSAPKKLVLAEPQSLAEVSELDASENQFEPGDRLLEVYRPVWTPDGTQLLFEIYSPYDSVTHRGSQLWQGFAGVTLSSLLVLGVLITPLVWRLLRRLAEVQNQRERILGRTIEASEGERRRIAGTLHDGPVQDLVATSYVAAGAAARAEASGDPELADDLRGLASGLRGNVRVLRSLLVDIYPANLATAGLPSALADLAHSATSRGLVIRLDLPESDELGLTESDERLFYRVAQECLRNSIKHAPHATVTMRLARENDTVVLDMSDDGPGFDATGLHHAPEGHLGIKVLADLATDAGAQLDLASQPGAGVHWRLSVIPTEERP